MMNNYDTVNYTGVTSDLVGRVYQYKNKLINGFTKRYNVTKLVYFENYHNIKAAIVREKQIKGWTRKKKMDLIKSLNPDLHDLYEDIVK
jgi:putative endonuclease